MGTKVLPCDFTLVNHLIIFVLVGTKIYLIKK
jgi:hypothetical protein